MPNFKLICWWLVWNSGISIIATTNCSQVMIKEMEIAFLHRRNVCCAQRQQQITELAKCNATLEKAVATSLQQIQTQQLELELMLQQTDLPPPPGRILSLMQSLLSILQCVCGGFKKTENHYE